MNGPRSQPYLQLFLLVIACSCCCTRAFAFTCPPQTIVNSRTQQFRSTTKCTTLHYSSSSDNDSHPPNINQQQQRVEVAGVSVSPVGFLVILQSIMNDAQNQKVEVAFPIQLTSSGSSMHSNSNRAKTRTKNRISPTTTNHHTALHYLSHNWFDRTNF